MALDRQAMIPSVFFGEGHKNWAIATPANKIFHSPDLVRYDYNPDESKKLLASLGFKDGNGDGVLEDARGNPVTFSLKTNSDNTLRIGLANFVKDDLAKVGINVVLAPAEFNTIITNIRADFQYDAIVAGAAERRPSGSGHDAERLPIVGADALLESRPAEAGDARRGPHRPADGRDRDRFRT